MGAGVGEGRRDDASEAVRGARRRQTTGLRERPPPYPPPEYRERGKRGEGVGVGCETVGVGARVGWG